MNIQTITVNNINGTTTEHVIIERAPGEFTSMPKSVYDELQAKQNEGMSK